MFNSKKAKNFNKQHCQALNSGDFDQTFSKSSEPFFLSHFQQNCKDSEISFQNPNLELKSILLQNMKQNKESRSSSNNFHVKSYTLDQFEYRNLLNPINFLLKISRERSKLIVELLIYCKEIQSMIRISPGILENLCEIISNIISSNIYELKEFQIKESLKSFEDLIDQIIKEIDSPNAPIKQTSPLSIIASPMPKELSSYDFKTINLKVPEEEKNSSQIMIKFKKKKTFTQQQDLKVLTKAKFLLSKIGHWIHLHDVSFLLQEKQGNMILENDKSLFESSVSINSKEEASLQRSEELELFKMSKMSKGFSLMHHKAKLLKELSQFNPEIELLEQKIVQKYFFLKLSKWKKEAFGQASIRRKSIQCALEDQMICKICLRSIPLKKITYHSELCMQRGEAQRQVETLKGYFTGYCLKANKNARYFEKVYGIEKKKQPLEKKKSENKPFKMSKSVKNYKGKLKILIYEEEKYDFRNSYDGFSERMKCFNTNSPIQCRNPAFTQENLTKIYRKIKLYDLMAKTSNFFVHEELDQSLYLFLFSLNNEILFRNRIEIERNR